MSKHRSMVTVESTGTHVTVTVTCDQCAGGVFTIATAHLETLARVLPSICEHAGIDLSQGLTESHVFDLEEPEARRRAEAVYAEFVKRRKATEH